MMFHIVYSAPKAVYSAVETELNRKLIEAVRNSDESAVEDLVQIGANPNFRNGSGKSIFEIALEKGQDNIVLILLTSPQIDSETLENYAGRALRKASHDGKANIVRELLEVPDIQIDELDVEKKTALMYAVDRGQLSIVQMLVKKGANPNLKYADGQNMLEVAIVHGYDDVAHFLLGVNGIDVNVRNINQATPLMQFSYKGDEAAVRQILSMKGQINAMDNGGWTALMWAIDSENINIVRMLLEGGADPNLKNAAGESALEIAIKKNFEDIVFLLLSSPQINVNLQNSSGVTALMKFSHRGNERMVREILKNPHVQIDIADNDGWTALMLAVKNGKTNVVKMLLEEGANPNLKKLHGNNAIEIAIEKGFDKIALLLVNTPSINLNLRNGDRLTALMIASLQGNENIVRAILSKPGVEIDAAATNGWTSLMIAAKHGKASIVKALLEGGADPNLQKASGENALQIAIRVGHEEIAFLLIKSPQIDINLQNNNGVTALMMAVVKGSENIVRAILGKIGLQIDAEDEGQWTALMHAAKRDNANIVEALLERGADPDFVNAYNETARDIAFAQGNQNIVQIIDFMREKIRAKENIMTRLREEQEHSSFD